jgi:penicillin amidase
LPEDRAKSYTTLDSKSNWDKEAVSKMLVDNTSLVSPVIVKYLIETVDQKSLSENGARSIEIMKKWQGTNNLKMLHLPFTTNGFIFIKTHSKMN